MRFISSILLVALSLSLRSAALADPTLNEVMNGCNGPHKSASDLNCEELWMAIDEYKKIDNANSDGKACVKNTKEFASLLNKSFRCKNLGRGDSSCTSQCSQSAIKLQMGKFKHASLYSKDQLRKISAQMAEKSRYCSQMVASSQSRDVSGLTPPSCEITIAEEKPERISPLPREERRPASVVRPQPVPSEAPTAPVAEPPAAAPAGDGFEPVGR